MDYDRTTIPAGYDRAREHGPEMLELWMRTLAGHLDSTPVDSILDLGCGTGRFSKTLAEHFGADVIAIDPSTKMLEQARAKPSTRVEYRDGSAEAIPLGAASVDVIFTSMTFHHFNDRDLAACECRRVLRPGGTLFVRAGSREQIPTYPYVPFIPATLPILERVLPSRRVMRDVFEGAGFQCIAEELVAQMIAPGWLAYADKLAAGGDSVLAQLRPAELVAGLAAIRAHAAAALREPIVEEIDLLVFRTNRCHPEPSRFAQGRLREGSATGNTDRSFDARFK